MKPSYKLVITPTDNGIIVRVGCKLLVFEDHNYRRFLDLLKRYLAGQEEELRRELFPEDFSNEPTDAMAPPTALDQPETCCDPGGSDF